MTRQCVCDKKMMMIIIDKNALQTGVRFFTQHPLNLIFNVKSYKLATMHYFNVNAFIRWYI